jgi:hypothetical protein
LTVLYGLYANFFVFNELISKYLYTKPTQQQD